MEPWVNPDKDPAMESIAAVLKSQREQRKLSLSQVAADTRISTRHLESIEEGRFDDLPGGMYNRAFLRAYCERLGLDQSEMLERYESEVSPRTEKPMRSRTPIDPGTSWRIPPALVWSLMLALSAAGIFLARESIYEIFSPYFSRPAAPAVTYAPPASAAASASAGSAPSGDAGTGAAPSPDSAPATGAAPSTDSAPATGSAPSTGTADQSGEAAAAAEADGILRLEVEGTESSWISISSDGGPAIQKILEPGEIQSASATEQIRIVVGNAGGVRLRINGKRAKPLGRSGEVVRLLIDRATLAGLLDPGAG